MPKPTQKEMKAAVVDMLIDALGELQGTLSLEMRYFHKSYWYKHGITPLARRDARHPLEDFTFNIDNPVDKARPFVVKVSVPQA